MLQFKVLDNGEPPSAFPLRSAHVLGPDAVAIRAKIHFADGLIRVEKRDSGAAALALQHDAGACGEFVVQTTLLREREEPYLLSLELARHRLMALTLKLEDWQMFELPDSHPVMDRLKRSQRLFFDALCYQSEDPARADRTAKECLEVAIDGGEELAVSYAEGLLARRRETGYVPNRPIGGGIAIDSRHKPLRPWIREHLDFLQISTPWAQLQPRENGYAWRPLDSWLNWAYQAGVPAMVGPLVSFASGHIPDWVYVWQHSFNTLRELIYEHVENVLGRYGSTVPAWKVVSGLHVNHRLGCSFDQILELTRMTATVVKQRQPGAKALIEIDQPFGEYFAWHQQSIPPGTYAELMMQGATEFDGFVLRLLFGQAQPGQHARDLLQASMLIDHYAALGKPLHLVIGAPSRPVTEEMVATEADERVDPECGHWRKPWSPQVQARWFDAVAHVAMSKPQVESITWLHTMDHPEMELPLSGLIGEDHQPRPITRHVAGFRRLLRTTPAQAEATQHASARA